MHSCIISTKHSENANKSQLFNLFNYMYVFFLISQALGVLEMIHPTNE